MEEAKLKSVAVEAGKGLGYPSMKLEQGDVAVAMIQGRDVCYLIHTGFRKSLWYACLPFVFDSLFQKDQVG